MCCVSLLTVAAKHRIDTVNSKLRVPELRWYPGRNRQEKAMYICAKFGYVNFLNSLSRASSKMYYLPRIAHNDWTWYLMLSPMHITMKTK